VLHWNESCIISGIIPAFVERKWQKPERTIVIMVFRIIS
jgi:hypothetical protein